MSRRGKFGGRGNKPQCPKQAARPSRAAGLSGAAPGTSRLGGTSLARPGGEPFSRARGARLGLRLGQTRLGLEQAGPRRGQGRGRGTKGLSGLVRSSPADLTRSRGLAPRTPPGIPDPGPQAWPFRPPKALAPPVPSSSYPGLSSQTAPVQLQAGRGQSQARPRLSSYQEAAGRAGRAGQAAQEKPRLVPPLPPRGPGDREARGSPDRRQPAHVRSPARGSSGPQLTGPRGAASGGGGWPRPSRSRRGKGGGSGESGAGKLRRAAELGGGGAKRRSRQRPHRPPGGALRRPVGRRRSSPNLGRQATRGRRR